MANTFTDGDPGSLLGQFTGAEDPQLGTSETAGTPEHCRTGADANTYVDCRVVLTAQSLDAVWSEALPEQTGTAYVAPGIRLFTGGVSTGTAPPYSARNGSSPGITPARYRPATPTRLPT